MDDHVYKLIEIVGTSTKSIDDAIQNGISRAGETLRRLDWFEVLSTRGNIRDGRVAHYQVTMKLGFTLDGKE
jgi:flavin-binding protein dodecin